MTKSSFKAALFASLSAAMLWGSVSVCSAADVKEKFMSEGVTRKMGGYRPIRAVMDEKPEIAKTPPADLKNPSFGFIEAGAKKFGFIIDQPEEGPAKLFVDTNADGDFTNDPAAEWEEKKQGERTMYAGGAQIDLGEGRLGKLNAYRFDPNDPGRAALKNTMLYYFDFGYEFEFEIDGKTLSTFASGTPKSGDRLPIDRDGNGEVSMNYEVATLGEPFNFTGSTVVLDWKGGKMTLEPSKEQLPQLPLPPNLKIGEKALEFTATTMKGDQVEFPKSFKGKLVMLDFWATWCGPCVAEVPNMKKAYEEWHDKGFEILGISFDQANQTEKVEAFLKDRELPWDQIYEGKFWETTLGKQYDVSGIPFVLLVDGDTGEILATARQLRGPSLTEVIGEQLKKKSEK